MAGTESIIFTFRTFRKTADAVFLTVMPEGLATTCHDLMGICLMTYVKHKLILRSIIYIMKSYNKLDSSETRTEMTWIDCATFDHITADLLAECPQLSNGHPLDVTGRIHLVKQSICRSILIHMGFKSV